MLQRWQLQRRRSRAERGVQEPLRAALYGAEQMEAHGRALAASHRVGQTPAAAALLQQLKTNEVQLDAAIAQLMLMARDDVRINPAGEWLLDNYYLVEEQIRMARRHLPEGYSRELPHLLRGHSAGLPRVYALAREAIAHSDGRIDAVVLSRFIAAYQSVTPLTLGELWAIPIMLRLALIDNLRRMATQVMRDGEDHRLAADWARRLNRSASTSPKGLVLVVADMARSQPPLSGAFVAELTRGLHGRGALLSMPVAWVEQWVAEAGHSIESLVQAESQRQAADRVSISNSIGSLRFLDHMDWREFVETMSLVDQVLRQDPAGVYARMDFATRDAYRHAIERLARRGAMDEVRVAGLVLEQARRAGSGEVEAHVGYHLVDAGLAQTSARVAAAA
ncbi:cyclic beta 1-2 glucan synthetase, partial [Xanthomonas sp. Kuri4-2]